MKFISIVVCLQFLLSTLSSGRGSTSFEMGICRELERNLVDQFIQQGKPLPKSWDEFVGVKMIMDGLLERNSFRIEAINSFAFVPDSPVVRGRNIPNKYIGNRLFLISRETNFTKDSIAGRFAIFIRPEEFDSDSVPTFSDFVPEETAKIILNQLGRFDPQTQPQAFDDDFIFRNRNTIKGDRLNGLIARLERERQTDPDASEIRITKTAILFCVVAATILMVVVLYGKASMSPQKHL